MSFTAVIPEVIAAQIVAGDQGATLAAASTALTTLAAQLGDTAAIWTSTFAGLVNDTGWQGAGAAAALAAANQYINWLTTTQTEVEAAQAAVAASLMAYEAARSGVVDLATVTANRTAYYAALGGLPFTAATVATLETAYAGFETTDIAVMNAYQGADAAALPGLTAPPMDVTGAILPISTAADTGAAANAVNAAAAPALNAGDIITAADGLIGTPFFFNGINGGVNTAAWFVGNTIPTAVSLGHTLAGATVPAAAVGDVTSADGAGVVEGTVVNSVRPMAGVGSWAGMGASAGVGQATTVGKLSVPATWAGAAQTEASLASSVAPLEGSGWTAAVDEAAPGVGAPGMPGMVGAGAKGAGAYAGPRYGFKPIVMPKQVVI
ncbi:PPE family protein [Mycobacterium rhizamassiliense]|jgi:PPE-repeat protein|uniref:PPE family protein n=1 Tax=Mycobacterium rhizamassiliense TaxID=1841860 RepID=A0A2U3NUZ4_9MYCO|nr:PPE domain-containing protein [Mycobacterium rhizamassiliense]SPM35329.1 PPE family protein [Mycobacterium rhizamassiliense]